MGILKCPFLGCFIVTSQWLQAKFKDLAVGWEKKKKPRNNYLPHISFLRIPTSAFKHIFFSTITLHFFENYPDLQDIHFNPP